MNSEAEIICSGMIENLLQLIMGEVNIVDGFCRFHQGINIIAVFNNGLLHLFVILCQLALLVVKAVCFLVKAFKAENKVVELSGCIGVCKQNCQPTPVYSAVFVVLIRY